MNGHSGHAYFLEEGLASVVLTLADGATVEIGLVRTVLDEYRHLGLL